MKSFFKVLLFTSLISACAFIQSVAGDQSNKQFVMLITPPKNGTHLAQNILSELLGTYPIWGKTHTILDEERIAHFGNSVYYVAHAPCTYYNYDILKKNKFKVIFLLRDPRDVIVSYAYWAQKDPALHIMSHYIPYSKKPSPYENLQELMSWSTEQIITNFIQHYPFKGPFMPEFTNFAQFYDVYWPWQHYPDCYMTTFEKLVGVQGGGDKALQAEEIKKIAKFLNIPMDQKKINDVCSKIFGGTPTFREGRIGSWKQELTSEHKKSLKALAGFNELLIALGYEKDDKW